MRRERLILEEKSKQGTLIDRVALVEDYDGTITMGRLDVTHRGQTIRIWMDETDLIRLQQVAESALRSPHNPKGRE